MLKQMEDEAKEEARPKEEKKVAAKERQGKKAFDESGVRSVMEPAQKEKADTCEKKGKELQKECLDLISEVKGDSQLASSCSIALGLLECRLEMLTKAMGVEGEDEATTKTT